MSKALVHNIKQGKDELLRYGFYLVLLHATRRPPHIAMLINGRFLSLGIDGPVINENYDAFIRTIYRNTIHTLFVSIELPEFISIEKVNQLASTIVSSYTSVESGNITCLAPIKDVFNNIYNINTNGIDFVFDLLPELQKNNIVGDCFHLNMTKYLNDLDSFLLLTYSMHDVNETIYSGKRKLVKA